MKYFLLISLLLCSCTQVLEPELPSTQATIEWEESSSFSLDDIMAQLDPEFTTVVPFQLTINHGVQEEGSWWQLMYIKGTTPNPTPEEYHDDSM